MSRNYPLEKILLPMNGTSVKDPAKMEKVWESDEYVAEEKYDGSRYLSIGGRFFSRRVSVVDGFPVEKTENVQHLHNILRYYPNLILDGEVYLPGQTSNEVTSIMGSKPDRALKIQQEKGFLVYMVFDILRDIDGNWLIDLPWKERRKKLEEAYELITSNGHEDDMKSAQKYIKLTKYVTKNKKQFNAEILARGGEGVMLKNVNGKYVPDKRPRWNWIKVKKELTDDVVIMGFENPVREYTGKELDSWQYWAKREIIDQDPMMTITRERTYFGPKPDEEGWEPVTKYYYHGWIGAIVFGKYDKEGNLVRLGSCSGISEQLREDMSNNKDKYVGQVIEISAMQKTKDGYYRHPQFLRLRDDKNAKDCVLDQ